MYFTNSPIFVSQLLCLFLLNLPLVGKIRLVSHQHDIWILTVGIGLKLTYKQHTNTATTNKTCTRRLYCDNGNNVAVSFHSSFTYKTLSQIQHKYPLTLSRFDSNIRQPPSRLEPSKSVYVKTTYSSSFWHWGSSAGWWDQTSAGIPWHPWRMPSSGCGTWSTEKKYLLVKTSAWVEIKKFLLPVLLSF